MKAYARFATERSGSTTVQFAFIPAFAAVIVLMFVLNFAYRS